MKHFLILLSTLLPVILIAQIKEEWAVTFDNNQNQDNEYGNEIVVDSMGNSYVAGVVSTDSAYEDFVAIKYDSDGLLQWQNQYNGIGDTTDILTSIALDNSGNVYVVGYSFIDSINVELITIKYDNNGNLLWQQSFPDWLEGKEYTKMVVDYDGNLFISGSSFHLNPNNYPDLYITTLKYSSNGILKWTAIDTYGSTNSIALSQSGNLYISAPARDGVTWDFLTIKYDSLGNKIWEDRWGNGNFHSEAPRVMALDNSENIYVNGISGSNGLMTIKYDSLGNEIWSKTNYILGSNYSESIKIDHDGNFYVLVNNFLQRFTFKLIKFDGNGDEVWARDYLGPYNFSSRPFSMTLGNDNIYIAGNTYSPTSGYNCVVLKYDKDGTKLWEVIKLNTPHYAEGGINSIALDQHQNLYATGTIDYGNSDKQPQIITIKYSPCLIEPPAPIIGLDTLCANDMGISYFTQGTEGSTFQWFVGGGIQVNGNTTDSILIDWSDGGSWPSAWSNTNVGQGLITVFETDSNGCIANPVSKWISIETCTAVNEKMLFFDNLRLYPNPFDDYATIEFDLKNKEFLQIQISNSIGQIFYKFEDNLMPGVHKVEIDDQLVPGIYFVTFIIQELTITETLIKK